MRNPEPEASGTAKEKRGISIIVARNGLRRGASGKPLEEEHQKPSAEGWDYPALLLNLHGKEYRCLKINIALKTYSVITVNISLLMLHIIGRSFLVLNLRKHVWIKQSK